MSPIYLAITAEVLGGPGPGMRLHPFNHYLFG
jgi:hypothetical protein